MRIVHTWYFLPKVEIKDYNVMIDQQSFFDQSIKNDQKINNSIQKIAAGQGDRFTTGCLLNYSYFKGLYQMIVIDLSKQQYKKSVLMEI